MCLDNIRSSRLSQLSPDVVASEVRTRVTEFRRKSKMQRLEEGGEEQHFNEWQERHSYEDGMLYFYFLFV